MCNPENKKPLPPYRPSTKEPPTPRNAPRYALFWDLYVEGEIRYEQYTRHYEDHVNSFRTRRRSFEFEWDGDRFPVAIIEGGRRISFDSVVDAGLQETLTDAK